MTNTIFKAACMTLALAYAIAVPCQAADSYWEKWEIDADGNGADGVDVADIDGDGYVDVVAGWEQSGDVRVYLNPGLKGASKHDLWSKTDISAGVVVEGIEDAAFADMDLDGITDTVISSVEGKTKSLVLHRIPGTQLDRPEGWRATVLLPEFKAGYMKARAAQIDGRGGADIVAGTKTMDGETASLYWFAAPVQNADGSMGQWQRYLIGKIDTKTVTLVIKNMDADGLPDVVYSGRKGVGWFRNPGYEALTSAPARARWERIVISSSGSEFAFCDLGMDGSDDIITATNRHSGMVAKWLKRLDDTGRNWDVYPIASDTLRPGEISGDKFVLKGVACGFVDGDDLIDVVFTASGDGHGVFLMSPRADISLGKAWNLVELTPYADNMKFDNLMLVDIDHDGDLDIVTTEEGEGVFSAGEGVLWFENPLNTTNTE
jgi:hypothetical protein